MSIIPEICEVPECGNVIDVGDIKKLDDLYVCIFHYEKSKKVSR